MQTVPGTRIQEPAPSHLIQIKKLVDVIRCLSCRCGIDVNALVALSFDVHASVAFP